MLPFKSLPPERCVNTRIKQNAYLSKILETKPVAVHEFKQAISPLLEFCSTRKLSKGETHAREYFKIKFPQTTKNIDA